MQHYPPPPPAKFDEAFRALRYRSRGIPGGAAGFGADEHNDISALRIGDRYASCWKNSTRMSKATSSPHGSFGRRRKCRARTNRRFEMADVAVLGVGITASESLKNQLLKFLAKRLR